MAASAAKQERIGVRGTVRCLLNPQAGRRTGGCDQVLVQSALNEAQVVIEREQTIRLSQQDCAHLLDLLDHPPKSNAPMRAAMKELREDQARQWGSFLSLAGSHYRRAFDCGRPELNDWLQRVARPNMRGTLWRPSTMTSWACAWKHCRPSSARNPPRTPNA